MRHFTLPWASKGRSQRGRALQCMVMRSVLPPLPCGVGCGVSLPPVGWLWGFGVWGLALAFEFWQFGASIDKG